MKKVAADPRWVALQALLQLLEKGRSLDNIFNSEWFNGLLLDPRDRAMSRELTFGLCRWYFVLGPILEKRMAKPLRARDHDIEIILILGLYQLLIMKTEPHAAVNETVKLAKRQKKVWACGLINAVLRQLVREPVEIDSSDSIRAYPDWIQQKVEADWDEAAVDILTAGNDRAPMTVRLRQDIDAVGWMKLLAENGVEAQVHPLVDNAVQLSSPCDVEVLPGFTEGHCSVQDAAAQLAAGLLGCESGMRVLDACAAPGGKTAHLLQLNQQLQVDALDLSQVRNERLDQNLARINCSARVLLGDAGDPDSWFDGALYDRVLADLPCSASGVIRRHPDIKLLRRATDLVDLAARQQAILDGCWQVLRPGGMMLVATCSIFKEENESQVEAFIQRHQDCDELSLSEKSWGVQRPFGRQILTGTDGMDGFYYARLSKRDPA